MMGIRLKDLEHMDLFRDIAFDSIPKELENARVLSLKSGDLVLSPEKENTTLYLVLSGSLSVHLENPDTRPIRTIYQGNCVGELSLIEGTLPSAWVKAKEAAVLIAMDHTLLWEMIGSDGRISKNLLSIVSKRVIANTELIMLGKIRIRELEQTAVKDALTKVYNRRWFDQAMVVHMNRFHRDLVPFVLCMADVDKFKEYNDLNGHPAGDKALAAIAQNLAQKLRPDDFVARYGGEEFGIILSETRAKEAEAIVRRLLDVVRDTKIEDDKGEPLPSVTISIGLAQPGSGDTVESLIMRADRALYRAKDHGRDCCFTEEC